MSDIKFSHCPFTAKHCGWCGELNCSDREYETSTATVLTYNTISMEQKELTAQEIVEKLIDEQKIRGKEAAILLNAINKPAEIRTEKEYTPWYQLDTGEPIDCINCTEDCMNCPGPYNNCSKTYTATKEVPDFTELTMMEEMERKEQKPQNTKSEINFADHYSKMIWEKLMSKFKAIEDYHIGANEVSDIVLNAILNAFMWQKEQKPSEWSEEDETGLKVIKEELKRYMMLKQYGTPLSVDDISWLKSLPERFVLQPKQEWSEEDKFKLEDAITGIDVGIGFYEREGKHPNLLKAIIEAKEWLKSLRPQPKNEWGEEDEHRRNDAIYFLETAKKHYADTSEIELTIKWLKSLQPKAKQEWSEEDEKDMAYIIRILDDCYVYGKHDLSETDHENLVNKLKSLHPQPKQEWSEDIIRKGIKEVGLTQYQINWLKNNVFPPKSTEYKQCLYGETPSVERCAVCSAWCDIRVREDELSF